MKTYFLALAFIAVLASSVLSSNIVRQSLKALSSVNVALNVGR